MRLNFEWLTTGQGMQATCAAEGCTMDPCPLACILTDDGGVDATSNLQWLRSGIDRAGAALTGELTAPVDWDREAWGASLSKGDSRIYSLHDDRCAQTVSTAEFRAALVEWVKFIEAGPTVGPVALELADPSGE